MPILTLEELKKKHPGAPIKPVFTIEDVKRDSAVKNQTSGNQFDRESNIADKAANFTGGGELASGLGKALAAPGVQEGMDEAEALLSDTALKLVKTINKNKKEGKDTTRLEKALKDLQGDQKVARDVQTDFTDSLPTNSQIVGSGLRLVSTAAMPGVTGAIAKKFALTKAIGAGSGIIRGVGAGAAAGALEGGAQGFGAGLEEGGTIEDAAMAGIAGAGVGAATGGIIGGTFGGIKGAIARKHDPNTILEHVTPTPTELSPTAYKKAVATGQVTPKTMTSPAKYNLPEKLKDTAFTYSDLIDKDPVKTVINLGEQVDDFDEEVGRFLKADDGVMPLVDRQELRGHLLTAIDDVTDIMGDEVRINKGKQQLVDNFIENLDSDEMFDLWQARKKFDRQIETAFRGSPTLAKDLKVGFRNAVQEFIADKTPKNEQGASIYANYMKEMTNLIRLQDNVLLKASKERADSGFGQLMKAHKGKLKTAAWLTAFFGGGAYLGGRFGGGNE